MPAFGTPLSLLVAMRRSLGLLLLLLVLAASPLCSRASSVYDYDDDEYEMPPPPPQQEAPPAQAPTPPRSAASSQAAPAVHAFAAGSWMPFGTGIVKMQKASALSATGSMLVSISLQPHVLSAAESSALQVALQTCSP